MTSLTKIAYGSFVFLHGRSRPFARYHVRRSSVTGSRVDAQPFADPGVLAGSRLLHAAVAFANAELDDEVEPNVTPWDLRHAVYFASAGFAGPPRAFPPPNPPAGRLLWQAVIAACCFAVRFPNRPPAGRVPFAGGCPPVGG
jgi:hypothetical protein